MREKNSNEAVESSAVCSDTLEQWAPGKIQAQLQHRVEEAVTTLLGRARHERRGMVSPIDPPPGAETATANPVLSRW